MPANAVTLSFLVGSQQEHRTLDEGVHRIGRADTNDIVVPAASISREHAELTIEAQGITIRDLGSANGTWVNERRVDENVSISPGDTLRLAEVSIQLGSVSGTSPALRDDDRPILTSSEFTWHDTRRVQEGDRALHSRLLRVLAEAGDLLTTTRQPEDLLEPILDLVDRAFAPERSILLLIEDADETPAVRASRVRGPRADDELVLSRTMVDQVIRERDSFLTQDALFDDRFAGSESIVQQGTRSAMAAPLFDNEKVIGVLYADSTDPQTHYSRDEMLAFVPMANVFAVAITRARYLALEEEKRRLDLELSTARQIMARLLPTELAACPGYEFRAHQEACYEVGGDLYDVFPVTGERLAVLLGDVAGKGLGAALLVSGIMPAVKLLCEYETDPVRLVSRLNSLVFASTDTTRFATLFFGLLDPATGTLDYVNAGHNPPLLVQPDGTIEAIASTGLPVGMLEEFAYQAGSIVLPDGALLALYSDGVSEAFNADEEEYGEARLEDFLIRKHPANADEVLHGLREDLREFVRDTPQADDITVLLVARR